ncbi:methyltransferase domain-containing protein [Nonomuraea sp. B1E8]|uniref:class I SAM-dependent methyltransferase n=1 Tax=unclassified Nonomuraea TaxID=2593643 RepID=UPI00325E39D6
MARREILEWGSIAERYAAWLNDEENISGRAFTDIVTDAVLDMAGDPAGKRVLDLGCGEGYLSRHLARTGAAVEAIDGAGEMLRIARALSGDLPVSFRQGDICGKLPYDSGTFELIVCNMVLMDVDDIGHAISEAARVLKPGGRLVFSVVHPTFFDATGEWRSEDGQPVYRPRRRYVEEFSYVKTLVGLDPPARLTHYHRPIQAYVQAVLAASLMLTGFAETSMSRDQRRPELTRFHFTANNLIIGATKPGGGEE